jgi:hypothetical protein
MDSQGDALDHEEDCTEQVLVVQNQDEIEQDVVDPDHVVLVNVSGKPGQISNVPNDFTLLGQLHLLLSDFL